MQPDALQTLLRERELAPARAAAQESGAPWRRLTETHDDAMRALAMPALGPDQALLATGSYGRRELTHHAELDLLLLTPGDASTTVHAVLAPLWDAGLLVRYDVRAADQPMTSRDSLDELIALLDARLICGAPAVFDRFVTARRDLVERRRRPLHAELRRRQAALVAAEPWQSQEPDVVTSRGGLNAFLALHWARLADQIADGLHAPSLADPSLPLAAEYEVLLRTQTALHVVEPQRHDRYRRDLAAPVAALLGTDADTATRRLLQAMRAVDHAASEGLAPKGGAAARLLTLVRRLPGMTPAPAPVGSDLHALMRSMRSTAAQAFDPLPRAPWLDRLLPEWEVIRALPRADGVHEHPVDTHLLRTVREAIRGITEDADSASTPLVAAELQSQDELLLAALLHDIGQGHEGDHARAGGVIAERFASRAGLDAEASRRLVTAVEQHQLLPAVASRRDLAEGRVIEEVAATVGDPPTLHLLYLLAVADARATGGDAWTAWRAAQLRTLYARVLQHMTGDTGDDRTALERRHGAVIDALARTFAVDTIEAHLRQLPTRYLLAMAPETIGSHLAMIEEAAGGTAVRHDPLGDFERLTIATVDRAGILSLVAGTLAVHEVGVLGGNAYTRDDGIAIQVLHVSDPTGAPIDPARWARIIATLPDALAGRFPIAERLAETRRLPAHVPAPVLPTTVEVDNTDSDRYSIVEIRTSDRLGLLYAVTHALHESGVAIHLAKVDTIGHEVADAFYVLRENGRRIEAPDEIERLRAHVLHAIEELDR